MAGNAKTRGKLTGRYADALAWQFVAFSSLRRFEAEGRKAEDLPLVQYACEYSLRRIQEAFEGIMQTSTPRWSDCGCDYKLDLRLNPLALPMSDMLSHRAALTIDRYDDQYKRLAGGVFLAPETYPGVGRLMKAFRLVTEANPAAVRVILAQRAKKLTRHLLPAEVADEAVKAGIINALDAETLKRALAARLDAIQERIHPGRVLCRTQRESRCNATRGSASYFFIGTHHIAAFPAPRVKH